MTRTIPTVDEKLVKDIASFRYNPVNHALYCYPWEEPGGPLEDMQGPRDWQMQELSEIALHLSNPETRYQPLQLAVASGHGIGKSALIGMIVKWGLDTCVDTRIVVTANTDGQLKTKTVPEVLKWCRMSITKHWFDHHRTSIHAYGDKEESWRCDFIPWSEHNTEAFAGLHNKGKRIIIIFDEGSAISDKIWEVVEGALTDEDTEILWIVFGNPTRNVGRFRECFRKFAKWWKHRHIDSREVPGTNKKKIEQWKEQYGEDSDFFRIRVRGLFPNQSSRQLYPTDLVERSQKVVLKRNQFSFAPVILSVDPSWTGDDEFVIALRQGLMFRILGVYPKNDNDVHMANVITRLEEEYDADAVFIDGGFGTGIYSVAVAMGRTTWQLVWFNEKSTRPDCVNKRAEMHVEVLDWMKAGGSIPEDDQELYEEAIAQETVPTLDGKYKLIAKEDMKEVLGRSPNRLDSLAISFAFPVKAKVRKNDITDVYNNRRKISDYDPLDRK